MWNLVFKSKQATQISWQIKEYTLRLIKMPQSHFRTGPKSDRGTDYLPVDSNEENPISAQRKNPPQTFTSTP